MDERETTDEAAAIEPSPVAETLTITIRQDGSITLSSDPPLDQLQLLGLMTQLQRQL